LSGTIQRAINRRETTIWMSPVLSAAFKAIKNLTLPGVAHFINGAASACSVVIRTTGATEKSRSI